MRLYPDSERNFGFWRSLGELYQAVPREQRKNLWFLVLLTIIGAFTEIVAIGAVVPFLSILANPSAADHVGTIRPLLHAANVTTREGAQIVAAALLCTAAIAAAVVKLVLLGRTQALVFSLGHQLNVDVQRRALLQPYAWHLQRNSSEQVATIQKIELVTGAVLLPLIQAMAAGVMIAAIVAVLIIVAPVPTIAAGAALGSAYYILGAAIRKPLEECSELMDAAFAARIRILQEALAGVRDLILDGSQAAAVEQFKGIDLELARARARWIYLAAIPRSLIEAAGIVVIAILTLLLSARPGGLLAALPALGAVALGAQRLLPLMQQLYAGWSSVAANRSVINDLLKRLRLEIPQESLRVSKLPFARSIEFHDVSFSYDDGVHPAVGPISFRIDRGSRVALIGPTGSGKSTTADLLMGLLEPSAGVITVDGVRLTSENRAAWRADVAHVPQMLFLADASVAENIALSGELDMRRVREAAKVALLDEFVDSLPNGFNAVVGERGIRISGGQRQRLAIARAIYKNAPVLVLDEATSALDDQTEVAIMNGIVELEKLGRTVIIIAHRSTLVETCDCLIRLEEGRMVDFTRRTSRSTGVRAGTPQFPLKRTS